MGDLLPVHEVSGMPGVGKTIALIGFGHEDDIKEHFVHGVLYMSVGATATVGHITSELCKILRVTGATTCAAEVQSSKSLADAVANAAIWFHGKRILYLIDDIWPTTACAKGYLPDLEGLLQGSPGSRITLSTRSLQVAANGGSHVNFGAREPCGPISVAIFMAHAAPKVHSGKIELESARGILNLCAGFPIALSVARAAVLLRINSGADLTFHAECISRSSQMK